MKALNLLNVSLVLSCFAIPACQSIRPTWASAESVTPIPPGPVPKTLTVEGGDVVVFQCIVRADTDYPSSKFAVKPTGTFTPSRIFISGPLDSVPYGIWEVPLDDTHVTLLNAELVNSGKAIPPSEQTVNLQLHNQGLHDSLVKNKLYHVVSMLWVDRGGNNGSFVVTTETADVGSK